MKYGSYKLLVWYKTIVIMQQDKKESVTSFDWVITFVLEQNQLYNTDNAHAVT